MLWKSIAEDVTRKMFSEAVERDSQNRKNDVVQRLSYYTDQQEDYIIEALKKHHADYTAFTPVFFNVVRKIVNSLSMVYLQDCQRLILGTEQDKVIFNEIVESSNLNLKMKTASRYCQLLKTIILRPVWRQGKLDLDIITGDILDVSCGDSPEILESVLVTHYPINGQFKEIEYSLWSATNYTRLDYKGNPIHSEPNPYEVVPFVPVWASYPTSGSFWVSGGDDLISVQSTINQKLTDLMLVLEYQGFGVPVQKGMPSGGSRTQIGPNVAIEIENPEGSFTFEKTNAPIQGILNSIDFLVKNLAVSNGLSVESISTKPSQNSGVARLAGNRELQELRKDQISLFGRYERQLFNMFRIVWNAHNPDRKISDNAVIKLDFFDPTPVMSPDKQAELWEKELEMGTISRTDILMLKNPDLSKEDAQRKLEEIKMENSTFNLSPSQGVKLEE